MKRLLRRRSLPGASLPNLRGVLLAGLSLAAGACEDAAPEPGFEPLFPGHEGPLMSLSSPARADLDGDGTPDIVYGTGMDRLRPEGMRWVHADRPEVPGWVTALSGATGELLWRAPHTGDAYTTPVFARLDGDGVPDVVMGGREGAFAAFSGADGSVLWRLPPAEVVETESPWGFSTPAVVEDVDGDGVADLVVAYGGDPTRFGDDPRSPGFLVVVSGAGGVVLAARETPDGAETYASPVVYRRPGGVPWVVFGTGGETLGGSAFRVPLAALLDGSHRTRVERLTTPGRKGVLAPATVVELTGDDEPDIAVSTFDGRLVVVDGASGETVWERRGENEESYHPAAVARIAPNGRVGLLVSRGSGVFPMYEGSVHRLYDGRDGTLLYLDRTSAYPAGAPLAVDLTGDGIEELLYFGDPGRIHVYHAPSGELAVHEVGANLSGTPMVAGRGDAGGGDAGGLELVGVSWRNLSAQRGLPEPEDLRSTLIRLDLSAEAPAFLAWAGYMGTGTDGLYRPPEPR